MLYFDLSDIKSSLIVSYTSISVNYAKLSYILVCMKLPTLILSLFWADVIPRQVYVMSPDDAPKHTVIKIKDSEKGGPMGQRHCWYQCTVKGGREGKDIDAMSLAKVNDTSIE